MDSFTVVQEEKDYSDNLKTYFIFSQPAEAKKTLEEELCRPFGWYLGLHNDGRIKLVRPKNPERLYVCHQNNVFTLTASGQSPVSHTLPGGIYTGSEVASALQTAFNAHTGRTFTFSYVAATGILTISVSSGTFTFSASDAWATIGHTTASADTSKAGSAVGLFTDTSTFGVQTIGRNSIVAGTVQPVDNSGARVARVSFGCNYDWGLEEFRTYKLFADAEIENLDAFGETNPYVIESKGLLAAFSAAQNYKKTPFTVQLPPANGCMPIYADVSSSVGIDASNSFATLFCEHLFDRYRNPPMRVKMKLRWLHNTLEVGDEVLVSHSTDGVFLDEENAAATVTSRVFEVVSVKPSFSDATVEVELLGHREGA